MSSSPLRRALGVGMFAAAAAAAPFATVLSQPAPGAALACPAGEAEDVYTHHCIPELSPNVAGGHHPTVTVQAPVVATPNDAGQITPSTPGSQFSVPEIDGVPCNNPGQCIGLEESEAGQMPIVHPHSTLSSSP